MTEHLFDPGPEALPAEKVSAGRKRTIHNKALIAQGVHPITGRPLASNREQCVSCINCIRQGGVAGTFYKCRLNNTHGPATDLRISWPACDLWEVA